MPMVIFGDGTKNKSLTKFKGLRAGVIDKLYKHLKQRERLGELLLLDIDEFNTSKCGDHEIHQVFNCNHCNIFWNRDVLVAKNMFTIASSIWSGSGRPIVFQRQSTTLNVVAGPSLGTA
ncbi:hypothetical protein MFLAVUS_005518 [Mucor flavus]|uniref:Transposase n=1 Tax=Mucor flavus TaxID=439312 RepID=A0ABP9YYX5_9FUNG